MIINQQAEMISSIQKSNGDVSSRIDTLINANILKAALFFRKNIEKPEKNKDSTRKAPGLVSSAKLLEHYSSNIDIQNVNQLQQDINILSYSVVFTKKMNILCLATDVFLENTCVGVSDIFL